MVGSEYFMRVATLTTWDENVRGAEAGDHKEPVSEVASPLVRKFWILAFAGMTVRVAMFRSEWHLHQR